MKLKFILLFILLPLIGCVSGVIIGVFLCRNNIPLWKQYSIKSPPAGTNDILYIDIQSTLEDPTLDIIYVNSESGKVYSNILFQDNWRMDATVPYDGAEFSLCATEWLDHPPVKKDILDSAGGRFERPLSTILRCYVLFKDGSLQVWTRSTDVLSWLIITVTSGLIGLAAGVIISIFIRRSVRKATEKIK